MNPHHIEVYLVSGSDGGDVRWGWRLLDGRGRAITMIEPLPAPTSSAMAIAMAQEQYPGVPVIKDHRSPDLSA